MTPEERRLVRLLERRKELADELAWLKSIWEGSPKYGVGALFEALNLCNDNELWAPPWLVRAVRAEWLSRPVPSQPLMHYRRWREVRRMRDERWVTPDAARMQPGRGYALPPAREVGYEATFEWVAGRLEKTYAKGSAKAIKSSYAAVERDLPQALGYRRTYFKRTY